MRFWPFYISFMCAALFWGVFLINLYEGDDRGAYFIPACLCTLLSIYWASIPSIHDIVARDTAHWEKWEDEMNQEIERRMARIDEIMSMSEEEKMSLLREALDDADR